MKFFLFSSATLLTLVSPVLVSAQENFQSLTGLPVFDTLGSGPAGLSGFFNQLYVIAVGAAAIIAVAQIMISGFRLATAGGSHSTIEEARNSIQNTILGLLLVLSPTIVFGIINPKILNLEINTAILDRPDVTQNGTYVLDPLVAEAGAALTRNEHGELVGVCDLQFGALADTKRTVPIATLGKGSVETGRACCRLMSGSFDTVDPTLCRLDELIDKERYSLAAEVTVLVREGSSVVSKNAMVWSSGADPLAGITFDGWLLLIGNQDYLWSDLGLHAIHGFWTKARCEAIGKSASALTSQLKSKPLGEGLLRINERQLLPGQGPVIPVETVDSIATVRTTTCNEIQYNERN